ncbi:MAG: putative ferrochelatase [Acidobacteria bacterium]|nr:putative ferrochelatase [Acidobacteriota bacterium]
MGLESGGGRPAEGGDERVRHVVLVTYGEPPTPAFAAHLAYSWRILLGLTRTIADIPRPLLPVIALARARTRNRTWRAEGYGSPLEALTCRQAELLQRALASAEGAARWRTHVAYEFRDPLLPAVLDAIPDGEDVTVVPMYATDSAFTHALSRDTAAAHVAARPRPGRVAVLTHLDADVLGEVCARYVLELVSRDPRWRGARTALVLAAHGTLLQPARPVETGLAATEALMASIRDRLSSCFGLVVHGWLNHSRGGRWTEPPIEEALRRVAGAGMERAVYFPYGFLADNAESQLEGRVALRALPGIESLHLPCLNDSPLLVEALARQVLG